jgi:hypothetical protein
MIYGNRIELISVSTVLSISNHQLYLELRGRYPARLKLAMQIAKVIINQVRKYEKRQGHQNDQE